MEKTRFFLLALILCFASLAPGQYNELVWNTFDAPGMPPNLMMGHLAKETNVGVAAYRALPALPQLTGGRAEQENGIGCLLFKPNHRDRHLSILDKRTFVRSQLLQQGRALFQADFYLPPAGMPVTSMAMVASKESTAAEKGYYFYRFGTHRDSLFFSFTNGKAQPDVYLHQKLSEFGLTRPGWHRFQIIFVGPEEIYCAVDGKFTSFSPIRDSTFQRMNVGIMMTTDENEDWVGEKIGIADNLSIQWTAYDSPLPVSPWVEGAVAVAGRTSSAGVKKQLMEVGSAVNWTGDSTAAWQHAQRENRPVLALFYVPNIAPYKYLVSISPDDEEAKKFLDQFILLRIDINQLGGGRAARNFGIARTPTLVAVGPDGKERRRIIVERDKTKWEDIVRALQPAAGIDHASLP